jgi:hypothetical protein
MTPLRKKSRSVRLLACKRAHNGSLSLPTFCGQRACGAQVCERRYVRGDVFVFCETAFIREKRSAFLRVPSSGSASLATFPSEKKAFGTRHSCQ